MEPAIRADTSHRVRIARASFAFKLDPNRAKALSSRELFEAAGKVAELMEHPGWVFLTELIEQRRQMLLDGVVHGEILSKSQYAAQTGMVSGLDQAWYAAVAVVEIAREREQLLRAEADASDEREG